MLGLGKLAGTAVAAALLLVPAAGVGAAAVVMTGGVASPAELLSRRVGLAGIYLVWFGLLLALGLATAARVRSSRLGLLVLVAIWIVSCVVVPRAVTEAAREQHPLPSILEFKYGINARLIEAEHDRRAQLERRVLADHGVTHVDDLPFNFEGLDLQDSEELGNRVFDDAYADLYARMDAQERVRLQAA
jgi:ABC-2 type transport system permease protein